MSGYWWGLATLPLLACIGVAAYATGKSLLWLLDRWLIRYERDGRDYSPIAGVVATAPRLLGVPIGRQAVVLFVFGKTDDAETDRCARAIRQWNRVSLDTGKAAGPPA